MKTKIFLSVLIVLIIAVFTGNWIYGNKVAKEIDVQLKSKLTKNEIPVSINYSSLEVNPLFTKVKITDVTVTDFIEIGTFKCKEINIDIPYKEALRLAESNDFEELQSLKLEFVNPEIVNSDSVTLLKLDDLTIDFDGHITKADMDSLDYKFPNQKQQLEFSFSGLNFTFPDEYAQISPLSDLQAQFTEIDNGKYTLVYLPEKKELDIKEISIQSPIISFRGNTTFKYDGNGLNDFRPKSATAKSDLLFEPKDIKWGEGDNSGEFSLRKLSVKTNATFNFDGKNIPEGSFSINVEKLKAKYPKNNGNSAASLLQLSVDEIDVEKLTFNYKMEDGSLKIDDTEIKSSMLNATIFADVDLDLNNLADANIQEAKIEVSKLSPELKETVNSFEQQMGKELPRVGDIIVLEITGNLTNPKIKGLEF